MYTNPDGTLDLLEIENKVRSREDAHQPISRLICVEQTHNGTGGRVLSLEYLQRVNFLGTLWECWWACQLKVLYYHHGSLKFILLILPITCPYLCIYLFISILLALP